jgi:hypothetical protein
VKSVTGDMSQSKTFCEVSEETGTIGNLPIFRPLHSTIKVFLPPFVA